MGVFSSMICILLSKELALSKPHRREYSSLPGLSWLHGQTSGLLFRSQKLMEKLERHGRHLYCQHWRSETGELLTKGLDYYLESANPRVSN